MDMKRRAAVKSLAVGLVTSPIWLTANDEAIAQAADCTLPGGGAPTRLVPNESRVLKRTSAQAMGDPSAVAKLASFRAAVQNVRARAATDVTGWEKLVAQHCVNCSPGNARNIHYSWYFLPWHRALLYIVERILRGVGDDNLRLPYWDWESAGSRVLPAIYAEANQSLFFANRRISGTGWPLADKRVDVQPLLGTPGFDDFGGTALLGSPTPATFSGPHANVHNVFAPGDMADLMYSPRDPVFYAHHANIDRLWASWSAIPNHHDPDFGNASVNFFDENGKWRFIRLNDLKDTRKLGYEYDVLMRSSPLAPLAHVFALSGKEGQFKFLDSAGAMVDLQKPTPHYLIIRSIQNLDRLPANTLNYGIFTREPTLGSVAAADPGYLGEVSRVRSSDHDHVGELSAALDVTGRLPGVVAINQNTLQLTVAGLDDEGRVTTPGVPMKSKGVKLVT